MSLTLADVELWNSGQVREVSTALDTSSSSMDGVKAGLRDLPILGTWSGQAADAATTASTNSALICRTTSLPARRHRR